jgi:hypothetical protein
MSKEKILNPKTNRMVLINSKVGREIKSDQELHVLVDAIIPLKEVNDVIDVIDVDEKVDDVIDVIDVNEEDVKKFDEASEVDVLKVIMDKKEYMKKYYADNRDTIINRTRARYKLKHTVKDKKEPVLDKKDYMKTYYRQNKDKITERSHNRYKIKKEISVFTDKINERLE